MHRFRRLRQFGIADLLILLTVVAAWTAVAVNNAKMERLDVEIRSVQRAIGELVISDSTQYHAIGQNVIRYPDEAWRVYLPQGQRYQLHLVTRGIKSDNFPTVEHVAMIAPGQHRIELRHARDTQNNPRFTVAVDEVAKIEAQETADWNTVGGSSSTGIGKIQEAAPTHQPLVLKRLRVNVAGSAGSSHTPPASEPANGLLIWITVVP